MKKTKKVGLTHGHLHLHRGPGSSQRQYIARKGFAVHRDALHTVLHGGGVVHCNVIHCAPVAAGDGVKG